MQWCPTWAPPPPCLPRACLPVATRLPRARPPGRAIKDLHRETAATLGVDAATVEEVETLLTQLQQLLVGISIMQVSQRCCTGTLSRGWPSYGCGKAVRRQPACFACAMPSLAAGSC